MADQRPQPTPPRFVATPPAAAYFNRPLSQRGYRLSLPDILVLMIVSCGLGVIVGVVIAP